jgi:urease accessory protein
VPLQRAHGVIRAAFSAHVGVTRLRNLHEDGSAKMRLPRHYRSATEAVLINTAGGLAGGDQFTVSIAAEQDARLTVTTQAHERAYRSLGDAASVETALSVGAGARLHWLPQETILFDRSRLRRSYTVDLDPTASFLAVEAIIFGRAAMGETMRSGSLHDRWRIRRDGRLIFADDICLDGGTEATMARPAVLDGNVAMATVILIEADAERWLDSVRKAISTSGGASAFDGKLIARITADDGFRLRQILTAVIATAAGDATVPRTWLQ